MNINIKNVKKIILKAVLLMGIFVVLFAFSGTTFAQLPEDNQYFSNNTRVRDLNSNSTLADIVYFVIDYMNIAILVIISLCVLMFVYGVYKHFFHKGDSSESRQEGASFIFYAVIGFFVIFSFWGLVKILQNTFNLGTNDTPNAPRVNTGGGRIQINN